MYTISDTPSPFRGRECHGVAQTPSERESGQMAIKKTEFWRASKNGNIDVVKQYIEEGSDVNAKDENGWSALMWASYNGHLDTAELLLQSGADVNAKKQLR